MTTCKRCRGTGKDSTGRHVRVKVPNTLPGLDRYKLALPLCPSCGGTGKKLAGSEISLQ